MRKIYRILYLLLLSIMILQFSYTSAELIPEELLTEGSAKVDANIWSYHHQTQTHSITNATWNYTYSIDDVWTLEDIGKKVVQFSDHHYPHPPEEDFGDPDDTRLRKRTSLIWQENGSWFTRMAANEFYYGDGSLFLKLSLLNSRTYAEIIDTYNAEVTFSDGSTHKIGDVYETLDNTTEEYSLISSFLNYAFFVAPTHIPSTHFIISPNSQVGQNISISRTVPIYRQITEITDIEVNGKVFQAFKAIRNYTYDISNVVYGTYDEYYFEVQTGLLIAYFHNATGDTNIGIEKFIPFNFIIGTVTTEESSLKLISITLGIVILTVIIHKRKMR
ncbi:MAG: hypothetical protein GPJ51_15115 [Candidatus Heimdallarchaeota archaeon]|nr:hypothetical protein [Candidatus Heimdallarchaeota archaeon]